MSSVVKVSTENQSIQANCSNTLPLTHDWPVPNMTNWSKGMALTLAFAMVVVDVSKLKVPVSVVSRPFLRCGATIPVPMSRANVPAVHRGLATVL